MFKIIEKFCILFILLTSATVSFSSSNSSLQNEKKFISALELSNLLQNYLKNKGIDSYPSIDKNKKFKSCNDHLKFFPVFKSWRTVEIVCSKPDSNWNIFVRTRANFDHNNTENQEKLDKNMIVFANKSLLKPKRLF